MEIERDGTCEKEHSFSPTHSNELLFVRPFYHIIWYVGTPSISSTVENLNAKLIVFSFPFYLVAKWMSSLAYVENGEQFSQTLNPPPARYSSLSISSIWKVAKKLYDHFYLILLLHLRGSKRYPSSTYIRAVQ